MNDTREREWCLHGYELGSGLCMYCDLGDAPADVTPMWLTDQLKESRAALAASQAEVAALKEELAEKGPPAP